MLDTDGVTYPSKDITEAGTEAIMKFFCSGKTHPFIRPIIVCQREISSFSPVPSLYFVKQTKFQKTETAKSSLNLSFQIILLELGIDYISPEDNVVEKQEQNGSVNGTHLKSIVDPYDELIKNHLRNEEKVKVRIVFTQ